MPPLSNDLLLAAALTSAIPLAAAQPVTNPGRPQTGVATTVKTGAARGTTTMYIDGTTNQRLTTDANSRIHVLFSDQSAVTIGPDSELVIAKYQFDSKAKEGQILIDLTKGLLRVVGGLISKKTDTVVRAGTATIGIRGGITIVETDGQKTSGVFLFGQRMSATDNNGNTQTITRPGFGTNFGSGQPPATPFRMPISELNSRLQRLETPTGGNPGNQQPGGAPPGQLLSTGNTPGGGSNPGDTLANDRLKNVVDTNSNSNPSQTLRNILATGQVQNQS
ncbi:FecR domain-containing protein [Polaromonas sp. A23]|uniref:FecR family protein n=1 Tax=Polaromonas sp. A23 TaxID=1944133 RepID=UPI000985BE9D|nr:FecR family protein [Polaromonas sp. A23]OOG36667.1 hypothetical protein B0B52_20430 [Polaromonas sp. A23]